jgi:polysaccharide biosynthesis protein PslH
MMRIAYIVPYVPNLIRTRPYNLLSSLTELGHEVDVFTLGSGDADLSDAKALGQKCNKVYYQDQPMWRSLINSAVAVPTSKPLQSVYSWHPKLAAQLKTRVGESGSRSAYDVIHVEHLRGSRYGLFIKSQFPTMCVVWDSVDCISHLFEQAASHSGSKFSKMMARFELGRTRNAEGQLLSCFDHVLVTSASDRVALLNTITENKKPAPITVLSNGVDQEYFHPNADLVRDPDTLVFSGKMSYHANVSMVMYLVNEIMPCLWRKYPNAHLVIAGKDPPVEVRRLANASHIHVTGTVDDIRPFLWKAAAAIVPLVYGAGVQNKILEAMATGTPVITNSKVLTSLSVTPGKDLIVANNTAEFAASALELMKNPVLRNTVGENGYQYVKKQHNWMDLAQQMVNIYFQLKQTSPGVV